MGIGVVTEVQTRPLPGPKPTDSYGRLASRKRHTRNPSSARLARQDRKGDVWGKRVEVGGRRIIKKKKARQATRKQRKEIKIDN